SQTSSSSRDGRRSASACSASLLDPATRVEKPSSSSTPETRSLMSCSSSTMRMSNAIKSTDSNIFFRMFDNGAAGQLGERVTIEDHPHQRAAARRILELNLAEMLLDDLL